jgi:hypothetical protein
MFGWLGGAGRVLKSGPAGAAMPASENSAAGAGAAARKVTDRHRLLVVKVLPLKQFPVVRGVAGDHGSDRHGCRPVRRLDPVVLWRKPTEVDEQMCAVVPGDRLW